MCCSIPVQAHKLARQATIFLVGYVRSVTRHIDPTFHTKLLIELMCLDIGALLLDDDSIKPRISLMFRGATSMFISKGARLKLGPNVPNEWATEMVG